MASTKEDLLPKIPTLKSDGSNWLTFKNRVEWAAEAKGLVEYLEGTKQKPVDPTEGKDASWTPTELADKAAVALYDETLAKWRQENGYVKQLIGSALLETLFMEIWNEPLAHSIWTILSNEFENWSCVVAIELQRKLQEQ